MSESTRGRIVCACGNRLSISRAGAEPIPDEDWQSEGWEKVGPVWTCWQCLGKPMPAPLLDSIRGRELDELAAEPEALREDALDYLDRLTGDNQGGQDAPRD